MLLQLRCNIVIGSYESYQDMFEMAVADVAWCFVFFPVDKDGFFARLSHTLPICEDTA